MHDSLSHESKPNYSHSNYYDHKKLRLGKERQENY